MPVRGRQAHQKNRGVSRGRLFLANKLGWLPGYPTGQSEGKIHWMLVPREGGAPIKQINLPLDSIQEGIYMWSKLNARFPRALPVIVPNLDHWRAKLPPLLDRLKEGAGAGSTLPTSLFDLPDAYSAPILNKAQALEKSWPEGKRLLDAYSWISYLHPEDLFSTLDWLEQKKSALTKLLGNSSQKKLAFVVSFCEVARLNRYQHLATLSALSDCGPLYRIGFDGKQIKDQLHHWQTRLDQPTNSKKVPHSNSHWDSESRKMLERFITTCFEASAKDRQALLQLFDQLYPPPYFQSWDDFWDRFQALTADIRKFENLRQRRPYGLEKEQKTLATKLEHLFHIVPPNPHLRDMLRDLTRLAHPTYRHLTQEIEKLVPLVPPTIDQQLVRAPMLYDVLPEDRFNTDPKILERYIRQFSRYLKETHGRPNKVRFSPWMDRINQFNRSRGYRPHFSIRDLIYGGHDDRSTEKHIGDRFEILKALCQKNDQPIHPNQINHLTEVYAVTGEVQPACIRLQQLPAPTHEPDDKERVEYELPQIQLAHKLTDLHDGETFRTYLSLTQELIYEEWVSLDQALEILISQGWQSVIMRLMQDGQLKRLVTIGMFVKPIITLGQTPLPPPPFDHQQESYDLSRFPEPLHPALRSLQRVTSESRMEEIVANLLGKTFPDPITLRQEIDYLSQQVESQPQLQKRLDNLRRRLDQPSRASAQKIQNLQDKLIRTVGNEMLARWEETIQAAQQAIFVSFLKSESIDPTFYEKGNAQLVTHILKLEPSIRELAQQQLTRRNGSPPDSWGMRDAKANQQFIEKLTRLGINMGPWLNPPPPQRVTAENGQELIIQFEQDPLEIFKMGGYFHTCLSPGSFNFFSAIVNGADINKHVIFARSTQDKVIGRCLIGLTAAGGIVTYHPYAHDSALKFKEMVQDVVIRLANAMETVVLPTGTVPPLMASRWYDDGPVSLTDQFEFLNWNSKFRQKISSKKISPNELVEECQRLFDPIPLNGLTLTLILNLSEITQDPTYLAPFIPFILANKESIPETSWFKIVKGVDQLGLIQEVDHILKTYIVPHLQRPGHEGYFNRDLMNFLIEKDPISALSIIRKSRPKWVRSDADESHDRADYLKKIYTSLGRGKKLRKMTGGR